MASGNERREQQAQQANATNQQVVQAQLQPSYGESALSKDAQSVLDYKGDYAGLPGLVMPTFYSKLKSEQAQQNRGAATFGAQNADPNLLAGLNATEENNAGQMDEIAFQDAVANRQNQARGEAATTAGIQGARLGNLGGQTNAMAMQSNQLVNQPGFWQKFLFQAMNNATQIGAAAAGR